MKAGLARLQITLSDLKLLPNLYNLIRQLGYDRWLSPFVIDCDWSKLIGWSLLGYRFGEESI